MSPSFLPSTPASLVSASRRSIFYHPEPIWQVNNRALKLPCLVQKKIQPAKFQIGTRASTCRVFSRRMTSLALCRDCSVPFFLSPYKGKYDPPPTTPDSLAVQKVMAGMADRGATACVYEVNHEALEFDWWLPSFPRSLQCHPLQHRLSLYSCFNSGGLHTL